MTDPTAYESVQLRHRDVPYQDTDRLTLKVVGGHTDAFVGRCTDPKTAHQYRAELSALFAFAGASHPRALTEAAVNHWVTRAQKLRRATVVPRPAEISESEE